MVLIKGILLISVFSIATFLGLAMANRYKERVKDLKSILSILNIIETKIKYTYEPLPQIFDDISKQFKTNIGNMFKTSREKMKQVSAGEAWAYGVENSSTNMNDEDLQILKNLDKMLGKTDAEGQLSELELMKNFIEVQIKKAEEEQMKNEKLYKSLGMTVGLALVIILV